MLRSHMRGFTVVLVCRRTLGALKLRLAISKTNKDQTGIQTNFYCHLSVYFVEVRSENLQYTHPVVNLAQVYVRGNMPRSAHLKCQL